MIQYCVSDGFDTTELQIGNRRLTAIYWAITVSSPLTLILAYIAIALSRNDFKDNSRRERKDCVTPLWTA
jgi:hypothetical protein